MSAVAPVHMIKYCTSEHCPNIAALHDLCIPCYYRVNGIIIAPKKIIEPNKGKLLGATAGY